MGFVLFLNKMDEIYIMLISFNVNYGWYIIQNIERLLNKY